MHVRVRSFSLRRSSSLSVAETRESLILETFLVALSHDGAAELRIMRSDLMERDKKSRHTHRAG